MLSLVKQQASDPLPYKLSAMLSTAGYIGTFFDMLAARAMVPDSMLIQSRSTDFYMFFVFLWTFPLLMWPSIFRTYVSVSGLLLPKRGVSRVEYGWRLGCLVMLTVFATFLLYSLMGLVYYRIAAQNPAVGMIFNVFVGSIALLISHKAGHCADVLRRRMHRAPPSTVTVQERWV